jgi:hypothetical protein
MANNATMPRNKPPVFAVFAMPAIASPCSVRTT